jgi:arylformamidase
MHRDNPPLWAGLNPEEHEFQYNPQRAFPDFKTSQTERAAANESARARLDCVCDVPYGEHELRRLDIYPARRGDGSRAPVHVFLHGGYWRAQDKENFAFVAGALVPHGITTVVVNYELCPASTLDGVVNSAVAAADWIRSNIQNYGCDGNRIVLSGHSAGAHLAAEIMAHDWQSHGVDPAFLAGAILISGIYDPTPAIWTSVNRELNLDEAIAGRHNVELRPPQALPRVAVLAGAREPWHWIDQSFRYAHHLHRHGAEPEVHIMPGWGHFDIIRQYLEPGSPISNLSLRYAGRL